jgi:hypothetical protein
MLSKLPVLGSTVPEEQRGNARKRKMGRKAPFICEHEKCTKTTLGKRTIYKDSGGVNRHERKKVGHEDCSENCKVCQRIPREERIGSSKKAKTATAPVELLRCGHSNCTREYTQNSTLNRHEEEDDHDDCACEKICKVKANAQERDKLLAAWKARQKEEFSVSSPYPFSSHGYLSRIWFYNLNCRGEGPYFSR